MFQRKYLCPVGLVMLLVTVWTLGWFWLARTIETGMADYAARQTSDPVAVSWDGIDIRGYPTRLFTHITNPRGTWTGSEGDIAWSGPATRLKFFTDFGRTVSFQSPGRHTFVASGALARDTAQTLAATNKTLIGRMDFDGNARMVGVRGEATGLTLVLDEQPVTTLDTAAFDWSMTNGAANPDAIHPAGTRQVLKFSLAGVSLTDARLDPDLVETIGRKLDRLAGEVALRGPLVAGQNGPEELARWRDAGGTVELSEFSLVWGPLRLAGAGTIALDNALQPVGAISARISGLDRLLDLLDRAGQVRPQQAAIARIALAVLTRAPADGGPPEAQVPITIQDRQVSIGPVRLLRLPPITWD